MVHCRLCHLFRNGTGAQRGFVEKTGLCYISEPWGTDHIHYFSCPVANTHCAHSGFVYFFL